MKIREIDFRNRLNTFRMTHSLEGECLMLPNKKNKYESETK